MKKIDSCNIDRGGVNSFTLRLLEESVLENGQADLCTAMEETECHRLQLIQFFIDYLYKICGRVVPLEPMCVRIGDVGTLCLSWAITCVVGACVHESSVGLRIGLNATLWRSYLRL